MSSILSFANADIDICEAFKLRLKLKEYEGVWFSSILKSLQWIEALEPIILLSEQMIFYKPVRYFAHHYTGIPRWPIEKPMDPIEDYPPELIPTDREMKAAIDWLKGDKRGSGRSYLIAICLIELATANPEYEIMLWDHGDRGNWGRDYISTVVRDIVWDVLHLEKDIVVNAVALICRKEGCDEITNRGTIGRR